MGPNYKVKWYKCGFCSQDFAYMSDQTELICCGCHATILLHPDTEPAPAGPTDSIPAGAASQAEVRKLAERVTVLEGHVDELCRALRAVKVMPAAEEPPPRPKGYWR